VPIGLDHIQIAIPAGGEPQGRAFYGEILGLTEVAKPPTLPPEGVWFEDADLRIHLGVDPSFAPATKAHPGFTTPALDGLVARLRDAGYAVREDSSLPGVKRAFTADPFGNRIELIEA
jgi:catechol 2,3-dioxygenase-like lactoylglutathione lyase family enzyme